MSGSLEKTLPSAKAVLPVFAVKQSNYRDFGKLSFNDAMAAN